MESKRNFYYNTEGVNGMGGNSNIGPTMPDESYAPTEPDRSEQRRNRDDLNGRRVYDSGKPVTEIERTSVIEDEQLVVVDGWSASAATAWARIFTCISVKTSLDAAGTSLEG